MRHLLFATLSIACLGTAACSRSPLGTSGPDVPLHVLVPPGTTTLAQLRLDKIKATDLYKRHERELSFPLLDQSADRLGFDLRRDLQDVLIAYSGSKPVSLVRGTFNPTSIEGKLTALGARSTTYNKHQLLGAGENATVFLNKSVAAIGTEAAVRQEIDLDESGSGSIPEELSERLHHVPAASQVWLVSHGFPALPLPERGDVSSALSNIVDFIAGSTLALQIDSGVRLELDLTCISEQGGKRVRDALRGAIGFGRLSTRDDQPDLLRIYDGIDVQQDKQFVHVKAEYAADLADKLIGLINRSAATTTH